MKCRFRQDMHLRSQWQDNPTNRVGRYLKARQRRAVLSREKQRVLKTIWEVMGNEGAQIRSWTRDP
jgi:hypothetical protein